MRKLTFTVTLEFEDKIIDDNEINEVAQYIADGLEEQANSFGLAPVESETFTTKITVVSPVTNHIVEILP